MGLVGEWVAREEERERERLGGIITRREASMASKTALDYACNFRVRGCHHGDDLQFKGCCSGKAR